MKPLTNICVALGLVAGLPLATAFSFSFYTGTCCSGLESGEECFSDAEFTNPSHGVCNGAAAPSSSWSLDKSFSHLNPCTSASTMKFVPGGDSSLIVHSQGGGIIGDCLQGNRGTESCHPGGIIAACLYNREISCDIDISGPNCG